MKSGGSLSIWFFIGLSLLVNGVLNVLSMLVGRICAGIAA